MKRAQQQCPCCGQPVRRERPRVDHAEVLRLAATASGVGHRQDTYVAHALGIEVEAARKRIQRATRLTQNN